MMIGLRLLHAGDGERKKVDQLRRDIASACASMEEIQDAPLPTADGVRRLMDRIEIERERAREALRAFTMVGTDGALPKLDGLVTLALLQPDFEKRLTALLASVANGKAGLPLSERQAKLGEIAARIELLELDEEREICRLEALGFVVERRMDVPIERLIRVWDAA